MSRRAKIVCTLGPASSSPEQVTRLVVAGMDVARLNMSHGTHDEHYAAYQAVRAACDETGRSVGVLVDLQGPKIRLGTFPGGPVTLAAGAEFTITGEDVPGSAAVASTTYPQLAQDVKAGDQILVDDGRIVLEVKGVRGPRIRTQVLVGGPVSDHKGLNIPGAKLSMPALSDKDERDLRWALKLRADMIALSFVRGPHDADPVRAIMDELHAPLLLIAKIEKGEAVEALDELVAEADCLMVARGDLGVEMGAAVVPLLQKEIILRALEAGKPVITATQMLESMVEHAEPTRAEASDVANAILDGTSAVMMSAETAIGAYPVEAVRTMDSIARAVEPSMRYRHQAPEAAAGGDVRRAMSTAAADLAETLDARAILVATETGATASEVARLRPRRPMVGLSHHQTAVQQMALEWGVLPLLMRSTADVEDLWVRTIETARAAGIVEPGDLVVLVAGTAVNRTGSTNVIKVDVA